MRYTLVKKVNDTNQLVINKYGFPFMFNDAEEANLEKIDQQMNYHEPISVYGTNLKGEYNG